MGDFPSKQLSQSFLSWSAGHGWLHGKSISYVTYHHHCFYLFLFFFLRGLAWLVPTLKIWYRLRKIALTCKDNADSGYASSIHQNTCQRRARPFLNIQAVATLTNKWRCSVNRQPFVNRGEPSPNSALSQRPWHRGSLFAGIGSFLLTICARPAEHLRHQTKPSLHCKNNEVYWDDTGPDVSKIMISHSYLLVRQWGFFIASANSWHTFWWREKEASVKAKHSPLPFSFWNNYVRWSLLEFSRVTESNRLWRWPLNANLCSYFIHVRLQVL